MGKKVDTVAIVGGGNGAFIAAAHLALKGFKVNLFEAPELRKSIEGVMETKTLTLTTRKNPGFDGGVAHLAKVTVDPEEAVSDAQVVFVTVPAFGQKRMAELLCDYVKPDQAVVLQPGNFGGSLEFAQVMLARGKTEAQLPVLMEFQCMIYTGFKDSPTSVWTSGYKVGNWTAAFPAKRNAEGMALLLQVYPDLVECQNVFETGMSNVNAVFHAPLLLCNAGWDEKTKGDYLFYWDGCTKSVGNVVTDVDNERMRVGAAAGMKLEPCLDILRRWYGPQGAKGDTLQEIMSTNPAYQYDTSPKSLEHRFFLEDVPYGMVPIRDLGKVAGVPTPVTSAVITIVQTLLQRDLEKEARSLDRLGLKGMDMKAIRKVLTDGFGA